MSHPRLLAARQGAAPLPFSHAAGSWVYSPDGARYLDAASGLVCVNIGHANPAVLAAFNDQAAHGAFASPGVLEPVLQERFAGRLALAADRPDDYVSLTTSGTSAVEMAIALSRLAQRAKGEDRRHKVLTASLSYHGNSAFTLALSGHARRRPHPDDSFGIAPSFDPPYPGHHRQCEFDVCQASCAGAVGEAIRATGSETVAALLIEPVNGTTGGGYLPPPGYLTALRAICHEHGVLVIHDEVLTGLGRTGLPLAAHREPDCDADLTVLSKGLAAGYFPAGAVMIGPHVAEPILSSGLPLPMMGTASATPLQSAVGLAVLSALEQIGALDRTAVRGGDVDATVRAAVGASDIVREIRGAGYFYGIELAAGTQAATLREARGNGLLLYPFNGFLPGGGGEGVIVAPPLNISEDEVSYLGGALEKAFSAAARTERIEQ